MDINVFLQALSFVGGLACLFSFWYAFRFVHRANGSSPLLQAIMYLSVLEFIWAGLLVWNSFAREQTLPSEGVALFISVFGRTKPLLLAAGQVFMIHRIRKSIIRREEGNAH